MFLDLHLPVDGNTSEKDVATKLNTLSNLGYDGVAISQAITTRIQSALVPQFKLPISLPKGAKQLKQYSRITVVISDPKDAHALKTSQLLTKFDIVAVRPTQEKLFTQACSVFDVDLISLELGTRLQFMPRIGQITRALARGVYFEICYSPLLKDGRSRQQLISNAIILINLTKGRNIVFSSEAMEEMTLRSPYDVANLGRLFGLRHEKCKEAITTRAFSVIMHGKMRNNTHKGVIEMIKHENPDDKDVAMEDTT